jgi:hypothetical protein
MKAERPTHEAEVYIPSQLHAIGELLGYTPHHQQQERLLHVLVAKDFRGYTAGQAVVHVPLVSHSLAWHPASMHSTLSPCRKRAMQDLVHNLAQYSGWSHSIDRSATSTYSKDILGISMSSIGL